MCFEINCFLANFLYHFNNTRQLCHFNNTRQLNSSIRLIQSKKILRQLLVSMVEIALFVNSNLATNVKKQPLTMSIFYTRYSIGFTTMLQLLTKVSYSYHILEQV